MHRCFLFLILLACCHEKSVASWWSSESHYNGYLQMPIEQLGLEIAQGKKILFIDTRETGEYREGHIPGAKHLMLRDIGAVDPDEFKQYYMVVPYCLKDFRGFEVARALMEKGLDNVYMMEPAGFNGWRSLGLPIAHDKESTMRAMKIIEDRFGEESVGATE